MLAVVSLEQVQQMPWHPRIFTKIQETIKKPNTLEYEINVPVRLLTFHIFSHRYALILDGTFIEIGIFRNLNLPRPTFGKIMLGAELLIVIGRYFH